MISISKTILFSFAAFHLALAHVHGELHEVTCTEHEQSILTDAIAGTRQIVHNVWTLRMGREIVDEIQRPTFSADDIGMGTSEG